VAANFALPCWRSSQHFPNPLTGFEGSFLSGGDWERREGKEGERVLREIRGAT